MEKECVILIHGLVRSKSSMRKMKHALNSNGFYTINWSYSCITHMIPHIAEDLGRVIEANSKYYSKIHFVTHSMGGIVLRRLLAVQDIEKIGKIVMVAPPNKGSLSATVLINNPLLKAFFGPPGQELKSGKYINRICAIPKSKFMIIAGTKSFDLKNPTSWLTGNILKTPNDGTVSVNETKLPGTDKFLIIHDSHSFIMNNTLVISETVKYLGDN